MNIKNIILLFFTISVFAFFSSCGDDQENHYDTFVPADAQIYAFVATGSWWSPEEDTLGRRKNDSIAYTQLGKTKFAIDQVNGIIQNHEPLPYGMIIENPRKLKVEMTVNSSYGVKSIVVKVPESEEYWWNYSDSIDFSHGYIDITVKSAADSTRTKDYRIKLNIHQTDPEQIVWTEQQSLPLEIGEQKTILNGDTFYTFALSGGVPKLYTSNKENINWAEQSLSGIPNDVDVNTITLLNGTFYASHNHFYGGSYSSSDGKNWSYIDHSVLNSMLKIQGILPADKPENDMMLVTVTSGGPPRLGKTKDLLRIEFLPNFDLVNSGIPFNAATATNFSRNVYTNMMFLIENVGEGMPSTWLIKNSEDAIMETAVFNNNKLFKAEGLSVAIYNDQLYVLADKKLYIGSNWGNSWAEAPEAQNLPDTFLSKGGQTMITDNENNIWIFGGKFGEGMYSTQVWKGRLNSLSNN